MSAVLCTYLPDVDVAAVCHDIWVVCEQRVHVDAGVISNKRTEIAWRDYRGDLAVTPGRTQA